MLSSEAGFGYLALKARFRKPRKVEEMVNKICVKKKNGLIGCGRCRESRREEERKEREGKQERAYLRKHSCHE